jgi:hypothetical protein
MTLDDEPRVPSGGGRKKVLQLAVKYRYTKYTGDLLDEIDLDDLVSKLSDLLLSSGFNNPWGVPAR